GLRAPTPAEMKPPQPGGAGVIGFSGATASPAQTLTATGMLTQAISLLGTTSLAASSVSVSYTLADGTPQTIALTGDVTNLHWTGSIPVGAGAFSAGSLPLTFTATDSGGTSVQSTVNLSLSAPATAPFTLTNPLSTLTSAQLAASNKLQAALTVTVQTTNSASGVTLLYKLA